MSVWFPCSASKGTLQDTRLQDVVHWGRFSLAWTQTTRIRTTGGFGPSRSRVDSQTLLVGPEKGGDFGTPSLFQIMLMQYYIDASVLSLVRNLRFHLTSPTINLGIRKLCRVELVIYRRWNLVLSRTHQPHDCRKVQTGAYFDLITARSYLICWR